IQLWPTATSEWVGATATVESSDPNIMAVAALATAGSMDSSGKMAGIVSWTKQAAKHIAYLFEPELDASSALKYQKTTCTGYANLGAAMGRAAGLPSMA